MPLVRLTFDGHYPESIVYISDKELEEVRWLEKYTYLFDSERGRELIKSFRSRPICPDTYPEIVCYV